MYSVIALINTTFQINDANFNKVLETDDYSDRFFLTFQPTSTVITNAFTDTQPSIMYLNTSEEIYVQLSHAMHAKSISLINTIGQDARKWITTDLERVNNVSRLKPRYISEGIYIVKLTTTNNRITHKKIIIKYKD